MTTKTQLSSLWDQLKVEASAKWKNEQKEEVQAFKAFCSHFERYNYQDLRRGIEYVIKHLIRNGFDWPTTSKIYNAIELSSRDEPAVSVEVTTSDSKGYLEFVRTLSKVKVKKLYKRKEYDTKNVLSMSGLFNVLFEKDHLRPALMEERRRRLSETRVDLDVSKLEDGNCWYCGMRCIRPNLGQTKGLVEIAEFYECLKCKKTNGKVVRYE